MTTFDAYIICGTPRSGSTLLCNLLASTKMAGDPDSFYRSQIIAWWAGEWGLPEQGALGDRGFDIAYLDAARKAGKGGTPIVGLRLMFENLHELSASLDRIYPWLPSDRARLEIAFGRVLYIALSREDKIAQAVSLVKAEQTGLWHIAPDGSEIERLAPPRTPEYDFHRIHREVVTLESHDHSWNAWFAEQGIMPLRILYERLSSDPGATLARICEALRVVPTDAARPGVAKLSDAISLDWIRRYRLDLHRSVKALND